MKLLLDTNVLIDFLGRKEPFFADAERVVAAGYFGDAQIWVSAQSFKDAFYMLSHYTDSSRVQDAIIKLLEVVKPVDLTGSDVSRAARLKWEDMEDCLIAVAAQKVGADWIVTRDAKGFGRSMVPSISPADWLDQVRTAQGVSYGSAEFD